MNFEILKRNHLKRNIIIGVVVVAIISACVLTFTRAKYRNTQSIPLVNGSINYTPYDFKVLAMYQEGDSGYVEIDEMPSSGYVINEEMSYCTIDNANKDPNAKLYTLSTGEHVIQGLKKNSKCYLYFDEEPSAMSIILSGRTVQTRSFPITTSTTLEGTNGMGDIYSASEGDGITYYFAGNPTDNWVYFAGFYWRIIRINSDGSIRLIYSGLGSPQTTGTETQIGTSAFNTNYNASYYVGFKYGDSQHGNDTNSTILNVLENWYSSNLIAYADQLTNGTGFCGDRNMASGYLWSSDPDSTIRYAGSERLNDNVVPIFECSDNDVYTVRNSGFGNESLEYPIGLITADEVSFAGMPNSAKQVDNYLYTDQIYWTMTPSSLSVTSYTKWAYVFLVYALKSYSNPAVFNTTFGVRPVINLRADVQLSGTGTSTDPYQVVGA